jgi:hypothetical protein
MGSKRIFVAVLAASALLGIVDVIGVSLGYATQEVEAISAVFIEVVVAGFCFTGARFRTMEFWAATSVTSMVSVDSWMRFEDHQPIAFLFLMFFVVCLYQVIGHVRRDRVYARRTVPS